MKKRTFLFSFIEKLRSKHTNQAKRVRIAVDTLISIQSEFHSFSLFFFSSFARIWSYRKDDALSTGLFTSIDCNAPMYNRLHLGWDCKRTHMCGQRIKFTANDRSDREIERAREKPMNNNYLAKRLLSSCVLFFFTFLCWSIRRNVFHCGISLETCYLLLSTFIKLTNCFWTNEIKAKRRWKNNA